MTTVGGTAFVLFKSAVFIR